MGGNRLTSGRCSWFRAVAAGLASLALAGALAACGGDDSSSGSEAASGTFDVEITRAQFPAEQSLGQTSLMTIAVRNVGERTIPALSVTISILGEEGETSSLPFAIHDPQADLAQPDRPVWVLAEDYPRLAGSSRSAGTSSSNDKSFDFGPLKAGETVEGVWKLSAVKDGDFRVRYRVDPDIGGSARAETADGEEAVGTFAVQISDAPQDVEVTDSGEVVELGQGSGAKRGGKKAPAAEKGKSGGQ